MIKTVHISTTNFFNIKSFQFPEFANIEGTAYNYYVNTVKKDIHEKNIKILSQDRRGSDHHRDHSVPRTAARPLVHQTLKAPVKIVEPVLPGERKKDGGQ
jgi:hypothetical protein